jgi:hypothetical protein
MKELKEKLDSEQKGEMRPRALGVGGMIQQQSILRGEVQTYEIYFPSQLREEYDHLYKDRLLINQ